MVLATDYANIYVCPANTNLQARPQALPIGPAINSVQCSDGSMPQLYNPLINTSIPSFPQGSTFWKEIGVQQPLPLPSPSPAQQEQIKKAKDWGLAILIILIVLAVMILITFILSIVAVSKLGKLSK